MSLDTLLDNARKANVHNSVNNSMNVILEILKTKDLEDYEGIVLAELVDRRDPIEVYTALQTALNLFVCLKKLSPEIKSKIIEDNNLDLFEVMIDKLKGF